MLCMYVMYVCMKFKSLLYGVGWNIWHPVEEESLETFDMKVTPRLKSGIAFKVESMPWMKDPRRPFLEQVGMLFQANSRIRRTEEGRRMFCFFVCCVSSSLCC